MLAAGARHGSREAAVRARRDPAVVASRAPRTVGDLGLAAGAARPTPYLTAVVLDDAPAYACTLPEPEVPLQARRSR